MSTSTNDHLKFTLPTSGYIYEEDVNQYILCKPKVMPLKSMTLEKLEKMQKEAEEKLKSQQMKANATE